MPDLRHGIRDVQPTNHLRLPLLQPAGKKKREIICNTIPASGHGVMELLGSMGGFIPAMVRDSGIKAQRLSLKTLFFSQKRHV